MKKKKRDLFQINTKGKQTKSISFFCLLLAGIYGILFFLQAIEGIDFHAGWIGAVVFLVCMGNCYLYTHRRWMFWGFYLIGIGIIGGLGYFLRETLWIQIQSAGKVLEQVGERKESVDLTLLIFLFALFLCFFLFFLELSFIGHEWVILLTTLLLFISPIVGITVKWQTVLILFFFQIIFYAVHTLERKNRRGIVLSVERVSGKQKQITDAVSLSMAILLGILFCIAVLVTKVGKEQIYHFTYDAEGYIYRTAVNALGLRDKPVKDGKISRSNNHQMGAQQLRIWAEQEPTEPLYLSGFHGEDYIGGDWTAADNREIYKEIANKLEWTHWENHINTMYSGMYYVMNSRMNGDVMLKSRTLRIDPTNRRDTTYYRPYYSQWQGDALNNYFDYGRYESGYQYRYYEKKDMNIDWVNTTSDFKDFALSYLELQEIYQEVAERIYTRVPEELLPKLTRLCQEHTLSELEEITAFILYTLHSNATYTLTPGMAPYGEDILEYFLFENGRGYCVHFAATATLMYRMYGIPARYVSGYMVEPTDFKRQEDGTYLAEVTDRAAHAWVEILVEDYGWTPVEVTPAVDNTVRLDSVEAYSGLNREELDIIFQKYGWDLSVPSLGKNEEKQAGKVVDLSEKGKKQWYVGFRWGELPENSGKEYGGLISLIVGMLLLPLGMRYWRLCKWEKIEQMGSRGIFFEVLKVLRISGYLSEYEGWEEDFTVRLGQQVEGVCVEELEQMMEIVNQAAFGKWKEETEDREYVLGVYRKIVSGICQTVRGWRRVVWYFFRGEDFWLT